MALGFILGFVVGTIVIGYFMAWPLAKLPEEERNDILLKIQTAGLRRRKKE